MLCAPQKCAKHKLVAHKIRRPYQRGNELQVNAMKSPPLTKVFLRNKALFLLSIKRIGIAACGSASIDPKPTDRERFLDSLGITAVGFVISNAGEIFPKSKHYEGTSL